MHGVRVHGLTAAKHVVYIDFVRNSRGGVSIHAAISSRSLALSYTQSICIVVSFKPSPFKHAVNACSGAAALNSLDAVKTSVGEANGNFHHHAPSSAAIPQRTRFQAKIARSRARARQLDLKDSSRQCVSCMVGQAWSGAVGRASKKNE